MEGRELKETGLEGNSLPGVVAAVGGERTSQSSRLSAYDESPAIIAPNPTGYSPVTERSRPRGQKPSGLRGCARIPWPKSDDIAG